MEPCCFRPTSSTKASRVLRPARPSSTWYSLKSWLVSQVRTNVTNIGTFTAKGPPCNLIKKKRCCWHISIVYCTSVFSPGLTVALFRGDQQVPAGGGQQGGAGGGGHAGPRPGRSGPLTGRLQGSCGQIQGTPDQWPGHIWPSEGAAGGHAREESPQVQFSRVSYKILILRPIL